MLHSSGYQDRKWKDCWHKGGLALQEFDFCIVHHKGTLHGNADALFRRIPHTAPMLVLLPLVFLTPEMNFDSRRDVILTYK